MVINLFPGTVYQQQKMVARDEPLNAELIIQDINTRWMPGIIQTLLRQSGLKMTRLEVDYAIKMHPTTSKPVLLVMVNPPTVKEL